MKKEPRYELVFSTRLQKKPSLVERMSKAMADIETAHLKLQKARRELKQLKP